MNKLDSHEGIETERKKELLALRITQGSTLLENDVSQHCLHYLLSLFTRVHSQVIHGELDVCNYVYLYTHTHTHTIASMFSQLPLC